MRWRSFFQSWECLYFVYSGFLRCVAWTFIIIFSQLTTTTYVSMRTSGKWIYSQLKFYWFNSLSRSRGKDSLASIFAPSLDSFCSCSREREFPSESKKMECRLDYFSRVAGIGNNSFTYLVVIILWGGKRESGLSKTTSCSCSEQIDMFFLRRNNEDSRGRSCFFINGYNY